jgi:transcriptional regulator with XRE-family HTH domain
MAEGRIHFGDNLARLMGVHREPGLVVAEAIGVSRQTVSELTSGARDKPSLDTVYAAAELFDVDPDTIYRRPFWEWAADYCAKMAEPVGHGVIAADMIGEKLDEAVDRLRERAKPQPSSTVDKAKRSRKRA